MRDDIQLRGFSQFWKMWNFLLAGFVTWCRLLISYAPTRARFLITFLLQFFFGGITFHLFYFFKSKEINTDSCKRWPILGEVFMLWNLLSPQRSAVHAALSGAGVRCTWPLLYSRTLWLCRSILPLGFVHLWPPLHQVPMQTGRIHVLRETFLLRKLWYSKFYSSI